MLLLTINGMDNLSTRYCFYRKLTLTVKEPLPEELKKHVWSNYCQGYVTESVHETESICILKGYDDWGLLPAAEQKGVYEPYC